MIFLFIPKNQEDKQGDPTKVYGQYSAWRGERARIQLGRPGLAPAGSLTAVQNYPPGSFVEPQAHRFLAKPIREALIHRPQTISSLSPFLEDRTRRGDASVQTSTLRSRDRSEMN